MDSQNKTESFRVTLWHFGTWSECTAGGGLLISDLHALFQPWWLCDDKTQLKSHTDPGCIPALCPLAQLCC